ncbi:hypothetical protein KIPB_009394 [Kipferlia bialata]|uniref:DUF4200 domain-containing protein n=1 Tax=Kipferlia bialata TaxID=797122 RepID=A0A9K3D3J9_9EUKA|nr:hypothetical protein KIPB_009394 [Kipferlia bialata]|eukprot:g9394.t1
MTYPSPSPFTLRGVPVQRHRISTPPVSRGLERRRMIKNVLDPQTTESTTSFVLKQREVFRLRLALETRQKECEALERGMAERNAELEVQERELDKQADAFATFLREADFSAVEAIRAADVKTREHVLRQQEVRRLEAQLLGLASDITRQAEQLDEYATLRDFIFNLHGTQTGQDREGLRQAAARAKLGIPIETEKGEDGLFGLAPETLLQRLIQTTVGLDGAQLGDLPPSVLRAMPVILDTLSGSHNAIPFKTPAGMAEVLASLEDRNLFLMQQLYDSEGSLDQQRRSNARAKQEMATRSQQVMDQLTALTEVAQMGSSADRVPEEEMDDDERQGLAERQTLHLEHELLLSGIRGAVARIPGGSDDAVSSEGTELLMGVEERLEKADQVLERGDPQAVRQLRKLRERTRLDELRKRKAAMRIELTKQRMILARQRAEAPVLKKVGKPVMGRTFHAPRRRPRGYVNTAKGESKANAKKTTSGDDDFYSSFSVT